MVGKCGVLDSDNPKFLDGLRARERRRTKCRDTSSAGKLGLIALVGISVLPNGEKYKMSSISGRTFTKLAFATGATAAFGDEAGWPSRIAWRERRDLFPEGVASGDPDSSSVLLWTRYPRAGEERHCGLVRNSREIARHKNGWRRWRCDSSVGDHRANLSALVTLIKAINPALHNLVHHAHTPAPGRVLLPRRRPVQRPTPGCTAKFEWT